MGERRNRRKMKEGVKEIWKENMEERKDIE
jgi:hypothetical protein